MPKYFIGNVLSPTDENQPEAYDKTFAFTKEESRKMNLVGKPVLCEHDKHMNVGTILRDWTQEDGSKWVLGQIKDEGLYAKFAKYSIERSEYGKGYYTGLSLQHEHIRHNASGKATKEGIEVSLVVDPRRNDCRIAFVEADEEPSQDKTKKILYKMNNKCIQSTMSEAQAKPVETVEKQQEAKEEAASSETQDSGFSMSREDMMKVIIQQQKDLEKQEGNTVELKKLKEEMEKQKAEELEKDTEKAYNLSRALVDQWAESLDASVMSEADKESVLKMAKSFPRESMELLRIAHCASKKHKELNDDFLKLQNNSAKSKLQSDFQMAIQKKRPVEESQEAPVVHAASKKAKTNHVVAFLDAMSKYNVSGSATENMRQLSEYSNQQGSRRKPYF